MRASMPEPELLECGHCGREADAGELQTTCPDDGRPWLARYDLEAIAAGHELADMAGGRNDLWRYEPVLPTVAPENRASLGAGHTPLVDAPRVGDELGLDEVLVKDEGQNPTGTFKARGMEMAMSRALELGAERFAVPTAGNAGAAMAAYAARAGVPARLFVPEDADDSVFERAEDFAAEIETVDGLITDAGDACSDYVDAHDDVFDLSTLKEPYRLEGKKTMGYELAAQLDGELPDVIVYPTGGGTGLIGMWKAFAEMEEMGWIAGDKPRMVSAQAAGCAPIVEALEAGAEFAKAPGNPHTDAGGLRVPEAVGDFLILETIRDSDGAAVAVTDEEIHDVKDRMPRASGVSACTESAATLAALEGMVDEDVVAEDEMVVLFNTGAGWTG
jgi:threonine synthase